MKFSPPFFCFDWLCIKKGAEIHIICKQNIMKNKFAYQVSLNNFKTITNVKFWYVYQD